MTKKEEVRAGKHCMYCGHESISECVMRKCTCRKCICHELYQAEEP